MPIQNSPTRKQVIFEAAYKVLEGRGYKGTSMLTVAKAASASNETLYKWFGNKQGLLAEMIGENAKQAKSLLIAALDEDQPPLPSLEKIGATILELVIGDRAISLNRAAASDVADGGELGRLIATHGRDEIAPLIHSVFERAIATDFPAAESPEELTEIYLALLIGDSQIRRVIGSTQKPSKQKIINHSKRVVELLVRLFGKNDRIN